MKIETNCNKDKPKILIKSDSTIKYFISYLLLMINLMFLLFCPLVCIMTFERMVMFGEGYALFSVSLILFVIGLMMISLKKLFNKINPLYSIWRTPMN